MRPEYRTVTIAGLETDVVNSLSSRILEDVDWKITVFEPYYTFDGDWVNTWIEIEIRCKRIEWPDIEEDVLEAGWLVL